MQRPVLVSLILSIAACGWFSDEEPEPEPEGPRLVGRVASVHADHGFVLVQGFDDVKLADGSMLTSRGEDERSASLLVTGERAGRYSAADVKAGTVEVGDAVFARPKVAEEGEGEQFDEKVSVPNP